MSEGKHPNCILCPEYAAHPMCGVHGVGTDYWKSPGIAYRARGIFGVSTMADDTELTEQDERILGNWKDTSAGRVPIIHDLERGPTIVGYIEPHVEPEPTATDKLLSEAPLGTSRWRHLDKKLAEMIRNESEAKELLLEARNHARLTQNMGLVRRIDAWLQKVGIL